MATQIKLRRDSYQNWYDNNPVLAEGEPGFDITNKKLKIGDGSTLWRALSYFDDQVTVTDRLANGDLELVLNSNGTLITPLLLPVSFTAVLDTAHMNPQPGIGFTDAPWELEVQFQVNPDGTVQTLINQIFPIGVNPGYVSGHAFRFTEADHGIPGYNFDVQLDDVTLPGGAGWTANLTVSQPPEYPSSIKSLGAVKLTADTNSLILGTDGTVTVSGAIKQGINKLDLNENNVGNVYLTTTTDDTTAMFMTTTSIQTYASETVSLYAGAGNGLAELETLWLEAEQLYADVRDQDALLISPATRSWASMPSYQAYDLILSQIWSPAIPPNLPPLANTAKNAYNDWQNARNDTSVSITAGSNTWAFNANNVLTAPEESTIRTTTGNLQITAGNYLQLNSNDFGQIEIGRYQESGVVVLGGTNTLTEVDGTLKVNANIRQNSTTTASPNSVNVPGGTPTVVFSTPSYFTSIKLVIAVEGQLDGDGTNVNHTQTCEATIAATFNTAAEPIMSVYGVVYTSPTPLATFNVTRNGMSGQIEVTAVNSQTTNAMNVRVQALQFVSRYD